VPGLGGAEIYGSDLVGLTPDAEASLVFLDPAGEILARTDLPDAGSNLAVSGDDAWFLGNAGAGNGIVHVRLMNPVQIQRGVADGVFG
jgi:hypothetical protein